MKTRKNTSVDNAADIYATLNHLKDDLKQALNSTYHKAFQSNYKPNFFNKKVRFSVKKPIAQVLNVYCDKQTYTRNEIAYFIKFFEESAKANEIIDPVSMFDCMRAKPMHGNLGRLLYRHSDEVRDIRNKLEYQIQEESEQVTDNLSLCRHYLSYAKGMLFNKQLSSTFTNFNLKEYPTPDYYIRQISKLKRKMNKVEITTLSPYIQQLQYSHLQSQAEQEMIELRAKRTELDITNTILNSVTDLIDTDKLVIIAVKKEILRDFLDQILQEQKQFLFRWFVYAKVNNLQPGYSESAIDKYLSITESILEKTEVLFNNEERESYSDLFHLNYFKENIKPDLMADDVLLSNNEIIEMFTATEQAYKKTNCMEEYKKIEKNSNWAIMFRFDEGKWENVWKSFVNKNLKEPLQKVDELLELSKTGPLYPSYNYEDNVLIELIYRAKSSVNKITKMQEDKNMQLPEASVPIQQIAKSRTMKKL